MLPNWATYDWIKIDVCRVIWNLLIAINGDYAILLVSTTLSSHLDLKMIRITDDRTKAFIFRFVQMLLSILQFSLGIVTTIYAGNADCAFNIITGIFGMSYYTALLFPYFVRRMSPAYILGSEIWLTAWWIMSLGIMAADYGPESCALLRGKYLTGCETGKALMGLAISGLVESLATLLLVLIKVIHPMVSNKVSLLNKGVFQLGAIFPTADINWVTDAENAHGAATVDSEENKSFGS